jgi:hypothetical protein
MRAFRVTPAVSGVMASHVRSRSAWLLQDAVLGSASVTGVNGVRQTAHVALCGGTATRRDKHWLARGTRGADGSRAHTRADPRLSSSAETATWSPFAPRGACSKPDNHDHNFFPFTTSRSFAIKRPREAAAAIADKQQRRAGSRAHLRPSSSNGPASSGEHVS